MPPYWDNKALPTPTLTLPDTFSTFWLFPSFLLKNKCFSDVIWNLKREKKKFAKRQIRTRVDRVKMSMTQALPSAPLELTTISRPL